MIKWIMEKIKEKQKKKLKDFYEKEYMQLKTKPIVNPTAATVEEALFS